MGSFFFPQSEGLPPQLKQEILLCAFIELALQKKFHFTLLSLGFLFGVFKSRCVYRNNEIFAVTFKCFH